MAKFMLKGSKFPVRNLKTLMLQKYIKLIIEDETLNIYTFCCFSNSAHDRPN